MSTSVTETSVPIPTQLQNIAVPEGTRYIARVKWFDNTLSYGFATITSGDQAGKDIFVHQSNILTLSQGVYRTLRMGEYIEFHLEESTENTHKYHATAVTGPNSGLLMCETNPRRPRSAHPKRSQVQTATTTSGTVETTSGEQSRPPRRNGGYRRQAPIQVVVEYPNNYNAGGYRGRTKRAAQKAPVSK